jgi:hypothetical protein
MNNENQNLEEKSSFTFNLSKKDVDLLFKYLSRADLKGLEVPEFNYILNIFKI